MTSDSILSDKKGMAALQAMGEGRRPLDLVEASLALGALDRRESDLASYRRHLDQLVAEVEACRPEDTAEARAAALAEVLAERHGYDGDRLTYDDLQNANLLRVIDRRRGLPVTLGILWAGIGRRCGWELAGLAFPSHFLLRLDAPDGRVILDPFNGGHLRHAPELRTLLKAAVGEDAELQPEHWEPVDDLAVLLRLQNNIKMRHLRASRVDLARGVVERMLWLAPRTLFLMRERALMTARLGEIGAALIQLGDYLELESDAVARNRALALLQDLRARLN